MKLQQRHICAALAAVLTLVACRGDVPSTEPPEEAASSPQPSVVPSPTDVEPTVFPVRTMRPQLTVYGDVPKSDRAFIKDTLIRAGKWLKMRRPAPPYGSRVTVNVFSYETSDESDICGHVGVTGEIRLILASECWAPMPPVDRTGVLVHEIFHALQRQMVNSLDRIPAWFVEGSAEYAAALALHDWDMRSYELSRSYHVSAARAVPQTLRGLTDQADWYGADAYGRHYSLAFLAVEHLVQGGGWKKLALFLRDIATAEAADWRRSFKRVFGMSVRRFYKSFDQFRASGYAR